MESDSAPSTWPSGGGLWFPLIKIALTDWVKSQGLVNFNGLCGKIASDFPFLLLNFRAQYSYYYLPQLRYIKSKWGLTEIPASWKRFLNLFNASWYPSVASINPNILRNRSMSLGKEHVTDLSFFIYVLEMRITG